MVATRLCPECGAELTDHPRCWLCYSEVAAKAPVRLLTKLAEEDPRSALPVPPWQFGLNSILLVTTFIAVLTGVIVAAPGLGIVLAIVAAPALVRTLMVARRGRGSGQPLTPLQKTLTFLATAAFVVVLAVSAGVAFYLTCWVGFIAGAMGGQAAGMGGVEAIGPGFVVGIPLGLAAGIAVAWWLIRRAMRRELHLARSASQLWQRTGLDDQATWSALGQGTVSFWEWLYANIWQTQFIPWAAHVLGIIALVAWLLFYSPHVPDSDGRTLLLLLAITALGLALLGLRKFIPKITPIALAASAAPIVAYVVTLPLQLAQCYFAASVVARMAAVAAAIGVLVMTSEIQKRLSNRASK